MATKKYLSLERLTEYDGLIKEYIDEGDDSTLSSAKSYTDTSVSGITSGTTVVAEATHAASADEATHATFADSAISASSADSATKATQDGSGNVITTTYETKIDAQAKLDEAKEYTDTKTSGLASTDVVDNKIAAHNIATDSHNDIRVLITDLTTKLNNFLDVDDATTDQLSEVITLINNNKGTLDSLTINKVNVSDIIDNLTTASSDKVLSANQGAVIKELIDALTEVVDGKVDESDLENYYTKTEINSYELITIDDIDEICGGVTEGGLSQSDIDELMAQLQ